MTRDQCDPFLQEPGFMETILVIVAVSAVTVVNGLLKFIIKKISVFERPASLISLQRNVAEKVFLAQFLNTAVSLVVVNAAIPELIEGIPLVSKVLFNGNHRDFDQMWYKDIGGPLMITMLINTMLGHANVPPHEAIRLFTQAICDYVEQAEADAEVDIEVKPNEEKMQWLN